MLYVITPIFITLGVAAAAYARTRTWNIEFFDETFHTLIASAVTSFTLWLSH